MKRIRHAMALAALFALVLEGCASSRSPKMKEGSMSGLASWYGQEYAGRLTANGEIFDPSALTAAHRTLPFGTIVKVTNPKNGKSVNVRINDRGPFIAGRIIDLSYGAADAIGLVADGVAPVQLAIVRLGGGESEAPKPLVVSIPPSRAPSTSAAPPAAPVAPLPPAAATPSIATTPAPEASPKPASPSPAAKAIENEAASSPQPPSVPFPIPKDAEPSAAPKSATAPTVPETTTENSTPPPPPREAAPSAPERPSRATTRPAGPTWSLQLGAFSSEENARRLRDRAVAITPHVNVVKIGALYRVRVGPFTSEVSAIEMRERFDAAGFKTYLIPE